MGKLLTADEGEQLEALGSLSRCSDTTGEPASEQTTMWDSSSASAVQYEESSNFTESDASGAEGTRRGSADRPVEVEAPLPQGASKRSVSSSELWAAQPQHIPVPPGFQAAEQRSSVGNAAAAAAVAAAASVPGSWGVPMTVDMPLTGVPALVEAGLPSTEELQTALASSAGSLAATAGANPQMLQAATALRAAISNLQTAAEVFNQEKQKVLHHQQQALHRQQEDQARAAAQAAAQAAVEVASKMMGRPASQETEAAPGPWAEASKEKLPTLPQQQQQRHAVCTAAALQQQAGLAPPPGRPPRLQQAFDLAALPPPPPPVQSPKLLQQFFGAPAP
mmetsp:Transcript_34546/g.95535  ORF Transcript_34546/g.95535 Transcript_34546/m.95535 type:complete len:336 (-) Transcript_34546:184-1191(-)